MRNRKHIKSESLGCVRESAVSPFACGQNNTDLAVLQEENEGKTPLTRTGHRTEQGQKLTGQGGRKRQDIIQD